uniref:phosphodiester glycosidase family protein n=1 Tax=Herbidospora sakaeratensis TaxID=564415 RepID=UPI00078074F6|nr:phosphodiester glycosidase family protein [Herbidospora sakaeratensis]
MILNRQATRPLLLALAAMTTLALLPAAAHADTEPVTGGIPLINTIEKIGPGIDLRHIQAVDQKGWYNARFLTVDLSNSAVTTDLLTAGPVASGGPLTVAADKAGAVAAVNGDFYDLGNSTAAHGAEIQNGKLRKTTNLGGPEAAAIQPHVGVSMDGLAQLVNVTVNASANLAGTPYKVLTVNAANPEPHPVPAGGMVAFTSAWGTYSRNRPFIGVDGDVAEVLVRDDKVVSVTPSAPAGSGVIPDDGFYLVGRDAAAAAIRALRPGDPVTLSWELADPVARSMRFALGHGGTGEGIIVSGGRPRANLNSTAISPRTSFGFKDGGRTLVLGQWNGPGGTGNGGVAIDKVARDMVAQGVETAVILDSGGSSEMVARALGDEKVSIRNTPSDGGERGNTNGVGVFVAKGDGKAHEIIVRPAAGSATADGDLRVFPGLRRALVAQGVDDHQTPVTVDPASVGWAAPGASVENGTVTAPAKITKPYGVLKVEAHVGREAGRARITVLNPLDRLELSSQRLALADTASAAVSVAVTGRDDQGYTAPIDPRDLDLDYDHDVVDIKPVDGRLRITPKADAATILTVSAAGRSVQLPITIGVRTQTVYDFDDNVLTRWRDISTTATKISADPDGLRIDFNAMRNVGVGALSAAQRVAVPGQPLRLRMRIKSSINVPSGLTYFLYYDANGKSTGIYGTGLVPSTEWQYANFTLPANTVFPITINSFQGINTNVSQQKPGTFVLDRIEADIPTSIDLPAQPALKADPLISDDGTLIQSNKTWRFATLSDVQFTADNPGLTQVATAAVRRIRATNPDLIVLNGDITDRGLPQDLALARQVLTDAGCDLVPVGQEPPATSTPDPKSGKVPCYYVPGNHESYGLNNVQSDLTNFTEEFGRPYRTFDHKGTRFIMLASSIGSLRSTAWDQLPMVRRALDEARSDLSVHNVLVFAHHPVDDPADTKSSQLGDRDEVALIKKMLGDFRDATGKGAAMIGSHAQIVNVNRVEGVPYVVLPSSGKDPYGTPDRGGFTGWVNWSVDSRQNADEQWIEAQVRAFAQSITLDAPASVQVGETAELSGSVVQPQGVATGSRVVPLRYPMSVGWGGSDTLAIGNGEGAVEAAQEAGKVAILDPRTRTLTALNAGTVTVSVTNDSMRAYTDDGSLAPITTSKTIEVVK